MTEEILTWEEMVTKYPDKWVALKNVVFSPEKDVLSATIVAVKTDDEIIGYEEEHLDDNIIFRRTTDGLVGGPINASFTITIT